MTEKYLHSRQQWLLNGRLKPLAGIVCMLLVFLLATIQTTHVHKVGADTTSCPLCVVLHTAAPVTPAAAAIVLVPIALPTVEAKALPQVRYWRPKFFTRPPPAGC